ncbi:unnamed protein product [Prorocentrum cordatum]|uniref:Uncharacterized protein n=1 Tax=Prorocentrum cordatum TaxID=2364126 RepID=A0ABN9WX31_9DINO|nr:unnamed protein product [Polarella glacialis]
MRLEEVGGSVLVPAGDALQGEAAGALAEPDAAPPAAKRRWTRPSAAPPREPWAAGPAAWGPHEDLAAQSPPPAEPAGGAWPEPGGLDQAAGLEEGATPLNGRRRDVGALGCTPPRPRRRWQARRGAALALSAAAALAGAGSLSDAGACAGLSGSGSAAREVGVARRPRQHGQWRSVKDKVLAEFRLMTEEALRQVRTDERAERSRLRLLSKSDQSGNSADKPAQDLCKYRLRAATTVLAKMKKEEDIVIAETLKDVPVKEKMMSECWTTQDQNNAKTTWAKPAARDRSLVRKRGHAMSKKMYRHFRAPNYYDTPEYQHCEQRIGFPGGWKGQLVEGAKVYAEREKLYEEEGKKYFAKDRARHDARPERQRTASSTGQSIYRLVPGGGKTVNRKAVQVPVWRYGKTQRPLEPIDQTALMSTR